jgi:hypothetical protein
LERLGWEGVNPHRSVMPNDAAADEMINYFNFINSTCTISMVHHISIV